MYQGQHEPSFWAKLRETRPSAFWVKFAHSWISNRLRKGTYILSYRHVSQQSKPWGVRLIAELVQRNISCFYCPNWKMHPSNELGTHSSHSGADGRKLRQESREELGLSNCVAAIKSLLRSSFLFSPFVERSVISHPEDSIYNSPAAHRAKICPVGGSILSWTVHLLLLYLELWKLWKIFWMKHFGI